MKKFLIIPDSFKGTLSSKKICDVIKERISVDFPTAEAISIPVADGGEGSVDDALDYITDSEYHELFSRVAKLGMGVELNTSVAEAKKESVLRPYRIARKCGCKFYLGSDAHSRKGFVDVRERFSAIVDALDLTEDDKFDFAKS